MNILNQKYKIKAPSKSVLSPVNLNKPNPDVEIIAGDSCGDVPARNQNERFLFPPEALVSTESGFIISPLKLHQVPSQLTQKNKPEMVAYSTTYYANDLHIQTKRGEILT